MPDSTENEIATLARDRLIAGVATFPSPRDTVVLRRENRATPVLPDPDPESPEATSWLRHTFRPAGEDFGSMGSGTASKINSGLIFVEIATPVGIGMGLAQLFGGDIKKLYRDQNEALTDGRTLYYDPPTTTYQGDEDRWYKAQTTVPFRII